MEYIEITAKTVNDAITEACQKFTITSDKLDYEVVEEGSSGFLGIGSKPAVIKARVKCSSVQEKASDFLKDVFDAMNLAVNMDIKYDEDSRHLNIDLSGEDGDFNWQERPDAGFPAVPCIACSKQGSGRICKG